MDPNSPEYLAWYNSLAPSTRMYAQVPGSASAQNVADQLAVSTNTFIPNAPTSPPPWAAPVAPPTTTPPGSGNPLTANPNGPLAPPVTPPPATPPGSGNPLAVGPGSHNPGIPGSLPGTGATTPRPNAFSRAKAVMSFGIGDPNASQPTAGNWIDRPSTVPRMGFTPQIVAPHLARGGRVPYRAAMEAGIPERNGDFGPLPPSYARNPITRPEGSPIPGVGVRIDRDYNPDFTSRVRERPEAPMTLADNGDAGPAVYVKPRAPVQPTLIFPKHESSSDVSEGHMFSESGGYSNGGRVKTGGGASGARAPVKGYADGGPVTNAIVRPGQQTQQDPLLTYQDYVNYMKSTGRDQSPIDEGSWNRLSPDEKWNNAGGGMILTPDDPRYAAMAQQLGGEPGRNIWIGHRKEKFNNRDLVDPSKQIVGDGWVAHKEDNQTPAFQALDDPATDWTTILAMAAAPIAAGAATGAFAGAPALEAGAGGAFDMGGSAGVFDSMGYPLYPGGMEAGAGALEGLPSQPFEVNYPEGTPGGSTSGGQPFEANYPGNQPITSEQITQAAQKDPSWWERVQQGARSAGQSVVDFIKNPANAGLIRAGVGLVVAGALDRPGSGSPGSGTPGTGTPGPNGDVNTALTESLNLQNQIAREQWDHWKTNYQPLELSVIKEAQNRGSEGDIAHSRERAMGDVATTFGSARGQILRNAERYGVNPGSGRVQGDMTTAALKEAAARAGASNMAADRAEQQGRDERYRVASMGRGIPASASGGAGAAANTANSIDANARAWDANTRSNNAANDLARSRRNASIGQFVSPVLDWLFKSEGGIIDGEATRIPDDVPDGTDGGPVEGPGTETSDDIPAKLSKGEFVLNAASVKAIDAVAPGLLDRVNELGLKGRVMAQGVM